MCITAMLKINFWRFSNQKYPSKITKQQIGRDVPFHNMNDNVILLFMITIARTNLHQVTQARFPVSTQNITRHE